MAPKKDKSKSVNKSTQPSDTSDSKTKEKQSKETIKINEKNTKVNQNKIVGKN